MDKEQEVAQNIVETVTFESPENGEGNSNAVEIQSQYREVHPSEGDDQQELGAVGGSEETFDKVCQPCLEDGTHVEPLKYCLDCGDFLCEKCVNMHKGVRLTRGHELVPTESFDKHEKKPKKYMKELCSRHVNEVIKWFCVPHEALCCSFCKSIVHSKCTPVETLDKACTDISSSKTLQKLQEMKSTVQNEIENKEKSIENLQKDKEESLQALQKIDEDIENVFQCLKSRIQQDRQRVEDRYEEIYKGLQRHITLHRDVGQSLSSYTSILSEKTNDEFKFVKTLQAEDFLLGTSKILQESSKKTFGKLSLECSKDFKEKLNQVKESTIITCLDEDKKIYSVSSSGKISMPVEKSDYSLCLYGSDVLITDWRNEFLHLVDSKTLNVKNSLKLDNAPHDLCTVNDIIAVTLKEACLVRFFQVSLSAQLRKAFKNDIATVEKCRGVAFYDKHQTLLVSCGGGDNEGPGHIRVFSLGGKLLQTLICDKTGKIVFYLPWKIRLNSGSNTAVVCDCKNLVFVNLETEKKYGSHMTKGNYGSSLGFDEKGRIIITDRNGKQINLLAKQYKYLETLVESKELDGSVSDLMYDASSGSLYVASVNQIELFKLQLNVWEKSPISSEQ